MDAHLGHTDVRNAEGPDAKSDDKYGGDQWGQKELGDEAFGEYLGYVHNGAGG